jgi:hypothetical protein
LNPFRKAEELDVLLFSAAAVAVNGAIGGPTFFVPGPFFAAEDQRRAVQGRNPGAARVS